jgi:hypothetical protein
MKNCSEKTPLWQRHIFERRTFTTLLELLDGLVPTCNVTSRHGLPPPPASKHGSEPVEQKGRFAPPAPEPELTPSLKKVFTEGSPSSSRVVFAIFIKYICWAGGMAQEIECLPSKGEALSSTPVLQNIK